MKKVVMLLSVFLLGMFVTTPVHAEENTDVSSKAVVEDNTLIVDIETNGKATDGVITIDYKPSVVTCTEKDVKIDDAVEMYSVNVVDGSVKISFIAEDAIESGTVAKIVFTAKEEHPDEDVMKSAVVSIDVKAYDEKGKEVKAPKKEKPQFPEDEDEDESQNLTKVGEDIDGSKKAAGAKTGDTEQLSLYMITLLAASGLLTAFFIKKRAVADTGRKTNK